MSAPETASNTCINSSQVSDRNQVRRTGRRSVLQQQSTDSMSEPRVPSFLQSSTISVSWPVCCETSWGWCRHVQNRLEAADGSPGTLLLTRPTSEMTEQHHFPAHLGLRPKESTLGPDSSLVSMTTGLPTRSYAISFALFTFAAASTRGIRATQSWKRSSKGAQLLEGGLLYSAVTASLGW